MVLKNSYLHKMSGEKKKHDLAPKVVQQNVDHHFGLSFETHVVFCDISKYYKIEIT